jgi:hypothetical protein
VAADFIEQRVGEHFRAGAGAAMRQPDNGGPGNEYQGANSKR